MTGRFELLEHTADVGIRAAGEDLDEVFAAAAEGLATIMGAWFPGEGEPRDVEVEAPDREALLVAWLDELIYLHEAEDLVFGGFEPRVEETRLRARVLAAARRGRPLEGQWVKAATYHGLRVEREGTGWAARVYVDV